MENDRMVRALFAAHAVQGVMAQVDHRQAQAIASSAYAIADAMMAEYNARVACEPKDQWGRPIR